MDIRNVELSIEDVLAIHRHWITKLYVEENKSEVEIVELLYERRLPVTISQIERCLLQWEVKSSSLRNSISSETTTSSTSPASEGWEVIPTPSIASSTSSYLESEPQFVDLYTKRPLPSLPSLPSTKKTSSFKSHTHSKPPFRPHISTDPSSSPSSSSNTSRTGANKRKKGEKKDKRSFLRVTCYKEKGGGFEVEMTLGVIGKGGPSPLEVYRRDEQSHERLVLGLERVSERKRERGEGTGVGVGAGAGEDRAGRKKGAKWDVLVLQDVEGKENKEPRFEGGDESEADDENDSM